MPCFSYTPLKRFTSGPGEGGAGGEGGVGAGDGGGDGAGGVGGLGAGWCRRRPDETSSVT